MEGEIYVRSVYELIPTCLRKKRYTEAEIDSYKQTGGFFFDSAWNSLYEKAITIDRSGAPEDVRLYMKTLFRKEMREYLRRLK